MVDARHPVGSPAYRAAEAQEADAIAAGKPTPRDAAALLIVADMAELEAARRVAQDARARLYERVLRQSDLPEWIPDPGGRTTRDRRTSEPKPLMVRHPDKLGYGTVAKLIGRSPPNIKRWVDWWRDQKAKRSTPTDAAPGPRDEIPAPEREHAAV